MYYVIYKITNQIDGKFYIGSHKTKNLNDNYMGSGKYLKFAIEKYGIENFKKEILFVYDNPESMYSKEAEIVNEDFLATENTYNLKKGGFGGWDYINSNISKEDAKIRASKAGKGNKGKPRKYTTEHINKILKAREKGYKTAFLGKKHTEETKKKIGYKNSFKTGILSSQYGTMWITNGSENKKIKKEKEIPEGWYKGRKIN